MKYEYYEIRDKNEGFNLSLPQFQYRFLGNSIRQIGRRVPPFYRRNTSTGKWERGERDCDPSNKKTYWIECDDVFDLVEKLNEK